MPTRSFPAWPTSVPEVRAYVAESLGHVPPQLCETATLLVSELATNVVRHAGAGQFAVEVDVDPAEGRLWVGVTDAGAGQPVLRSPGVTVEHGRGLRLVSTLADRWGARRVRGGAQKTVWFELRFAPA